MADAAVGWGVGRLGALAEFSRRSDEAAVIREHGIPTDRGALRLELTGDCSLYAGESLGHSRDGWVQWVAFVLPREQARLEGRQSIAELGRDTDAPWEPERAGLLFALGIGGPCFRMCVRVRDDASASRLRAAQGKS